MQRSWNPIFGLACLVFLTVSVLSVEAASTRVFVSIEPQKYFVQKIGGDLVHVSVLVPDGADPHTYEPKPKQMVELSKTALYFTVGIDFEKVWLKKIVATNRNMRIVRTDDGIAKINMADHRHNKKSQEGQARPGRLRHAGIPDPHVWLSPPLVKSQAEHILNALTAVDSKNQRRYQAGYAAFLKELDALDAELKTLFAGHRGKQFMVLHPSWGYFADAYGLKQFPIEIEGKDPKPAQLQTLIRHAREHGIKVVFVQPQFSGKSAEILSREIGGHVVYVDPLAKNWAENLRDVARKFVTAVR
jgi:zinc transport system substrate-binding protein